jgi:Alanyl-tRNA synthetase
MGEFKQKYQSEQNEEIQKLLNELVLNLPTTKEEIKKQLETNPFQTIELEKNIQKIELQITETEKQIKKIQKKEGLNKEKINQILNESIQHMLDLKVVKVFSIIEDNLNINDLKVLTDKIKEQYPDAVILCGSRNTDKGTLLYTCTKKALEHGIDCNQLLKETIGMIDGKGGGKKELAQGGGKSEDLEQAIEKAKELLKAKFAYL